jgi:hypothetical protein
MPRGDRGRPATRVYRRVQRRVLLRLPPRPRPGLIDARQHAEDLAVEHGVAELWAQHSDRIARGDGKAAQHTVEVALWALKHDIRVRTLQDPETFQDLLYAVVTGQRNNEDSKRKGLAPSAGRRRAAARGEYIGYLLDGYKIEVDSDGAGKVRKRMVLDPERQELIALIFRLALRGRTCGQIATSVNDVGWLTKPAHRNRTPRSFSTDRVNDILKNPRYAALASWNGEIVARGHWPAYLTEHQSKHLRQRLRVRRAPKHYRRLEAYLLAKLARCGRCGSTLYSLTGNPHRDGSFARRYGCASHAKDRGAGQCQAKLINADTAEAMLVASIDRLLIASGPYRRRRLRPKRSSPRRSASSCALPLSRVMRGRSSRQLSDCSYRCNRRRRSSAMRRSPSAKHASLQKRRG